jgi:hypothetical protein
MDLMPPLITHPSEQNFFRHWDRLNSPPQLAHRFGCPHRFPWPHLRALSRLRSFVQAGLPHILAVGDLSPREPWQMEQLLRFVADMGNLIIKGFVGSVIQSV